MAVQRSSWKKQNVSGVKAIGSERGCSHGIIETSFFMSHSSACRRTATRAHRGRRGISLPCGSWRSHCLCRLFWALLLPCPQSLQAPFAWLSSATLTTRQTSSRYCSVPSRRCRRLTHARALSACLSVSHSLRVHARQLPRKRPAPSPLCDRVIHALC